MGRGSTGVDNNNNMNDSFDVSDLVLLPTDDELFPSNGDDDHDDDHDSDASGFLVPAAMGGPTTTTLPPRQGRRRTRRRSLSNGDSVASGGGGTTTTTTTTVEGVVDAAPAANRGRWSVILVLVASAAGLALVAFSYVTKTETDEFAQAVRTHVWGSKEG